MGWRRTSAMTSALVGLVGLGCAEDETATLSILALDVSRPVLTVDALERDDDEPLDLRAEAIAQGCETQSQAPDIHPKRVELLELLDVATFKVVSDRGTEVVALWNICGQHPPLPEEIADFLRDKALPQLRRRLDELFDEGYRLFELPLMLQVPTWSRVDVHGDRLVQLVLAREGAPDIELVRLVLEAGWGWPFTGGGLLERTWLLADIDVTDAKGIFRLEPLRSLERRLATGRRTIQRLDESELTRRARRIQEELAEQLGWAIRESVVVRWASDRDTMQMIEDHWSKRGTASELMRERELPAAGDAHPGLVAGGPHDLRATKNSPLIGVTARPAPGP